MGIEDKSIGKLLCCWLLYPKKMYPHEILNAYFILQLIVGVVMAICGCVNLQWDILVWLFFLIPGLFNILYVVIMIRSYILWFTEKKTCQFKFWFGYQTLCCIYGIGWWTCLFAYRVMELRSSLNRSEKHDSKNHALRILQGRGPKPDDPGFIERPVGSYNEVAQQ